MVKIEYSNGSFTVIENNLKEVPVKRNGNSIRVPANQLQAGDMFCFTPWLAPVEISGVIVS